MAKPLDTESKFMGIFKVSNIYFLGAFAGFFLITFTLWARFIGFLPTMALFVGSMTILITFIGISNSYPSGFFRYWLNYKTSNQVFIPGFEPMPKKEGKDK